MGGKPVTDIPGIGPVWGERLRQNGFVYATQILGQYLVFNQHDQMFIGWLQQNCGIWRPNGWAVYRALQDWCLHHL